MVQTRLIFLRLMAMGFVMLLLSWFLLLLTVSRLIASSFVLSLTAYAGSVVGLAMGVYGALQYASHGGR
ncbi:MAG: hypothetical protein E6G99_00255 [Bacillati bacterium ANGP1]|uniref:Uncharacterized protein n=1 Tax=Candidatus Segetimicrobium genomatis TaxID=2569760 RepID=A0A537LSH5_9BACT|nr:MAG: hypothetical protein E6G99_00255 [Terrabacteria group bacterium ANGP1]TMJ10968.1 MAG: hypothetical protein E6G98_06250 [Terrabacteria group bacterium ANGP1]